MESDLLDLIRLMEDHPAIAKEHVLDELRRMAATRLWSRLTDVQRAYACGLLHGGLPPNLEWSGMPGSTRTIVATGVLRWAKCLATPSSPKPAATSTQAEPAPTPVGC